MKAMWLLLGFVAEKLTQMALQVLLVADSSTKLLTQHLFYLWPGSVTGAITESLPNIILLSSLEQIEVYV